MTSSVQPIRLSTHKNRNWRPVVGFGFARENLAVPVAIGELRRAALTMPLAFLPQNGHTMLMALQGLQNQNLFIAPDGRWLGTYVPAILRSYPFKLLPAQDDQFALGISDDPALAAEAGEGEPFFDEFDQPTKKISDILQFLMQLNRELSLATRASSLLQSHGLLVPWELSVEADGKTVPVEGALRIDEQKMAELPDEQFLELRRGGGIMLAYAQLFSMGNITVLGHLARLRESQSATVPAAQADLRSLFDADPAADEQLDWDAILKND